MKKRTHSFLIPLFLFWGIISLIGCELDERIDDLTGGYEGAIIDRYTGDTVATEYYGTKLYLLDLEYGSYAQPLVYNVQPTGFYRNTKVYPSRYKIWAAGPFFEGDTLVGDIKKNKRMDISVSPNISLKIEKVEVQYGIVADVTFSYKVNDITSIKNELGIVYGLDAYPGFKTAMNESGSSRTYKRIRNEVTEVEGQFTESLLLSPNTTYYIRALGRTNDGGDYWNYSKQYVLRTSDPELSGIPVEKTQGVTSATSAILQWTFPETIVDKVRVSYVDRDGEQVNDFFASNGYSYVANLPHSSSTSIKVELLTKDGISSGEKTVEVSTNQLTESYVSTHRDDNVPLFNDAAFRRSLSKSHAEIRGPITGNTGWVTDPSRYMYIEWWDTWTDFDYNINMPKNQDIENYTEFTLYGQVQSLVDLLPFVNLEKLTILPGDMFDTGLTISPTIDLKVLAKLKKLKTVVLGSRVPLDEVDFRNAGLSSVAIIRE